MPRADTRARVLRAAVSTLAAEGYGRTTARAIARTGGFAPGVIYYHFADLDDLLVATAQFTSDARLARYRAELAGVTGFTDVLERLRRLYVEDGAEGHIAAVQELVAAANSNPRLAEQVRVQTAVWQDFAAETIEGLLAGTPLAEVIPVRELATAAVALYLGMELLSHLHANRLGPEALFDASQRFAPLLDTLRPDAGD
ncbi:TetR/AcrR family transcriptional regulator [Catellatospora tritici]|uniref:TetR/AcrR family transcriptional regulator n=1 Tax=Catellatospora tritici TaxID=2851566 RepID=UPI001C2CF4B6|nr:TetR/AcrR family transcriptional regulator [Catellatospora tritici]MBV1851308.1 TetR/AcrR family transcriptional regulator [Catellatospora tritici]